MTLVVIEMAEPDHVTVVATTRTKTAAAAADLRDVPNASGLRLHKPLLLLVPSRPSVPARILDPGLEKRAVALPPPLLVLVVLMVLLTATPTRRRSVIWPKLSLEVLQPTVLPMVLAVEVEVLLVLEMIHMAARVAVLNLSLEAVEEVSLVVAMAKVVAVAGLRSSQPEEL